MAHYTTDLASGEHLQIQTDATAVTILHAEVATEILLMTDTLTQTATGIFFL